MSVTRLLTVKNGRFFYGEHALDNACIDLLHKMNEIDPDDRAEMCDVIRRLANKTITREQLEWRFRCRESPRRSG